MAQEYDRTMKRLTSLFAADYVELALGEAVVYRGLVSLEESDTDKELPSLSRAVDFVARVSRDQEEALLLLEFQTRWEADVPQRMASYTWRLYERYGCPVYPVVAVLRPGGALTPEWRMQTWGQEVARCAFAIVSLWQIDASAVIAARRTGLYPLLPLMRWDAAAPDRILEQSQTLILEQVEERETRADAYVALQVLSGIVYPPELVKAIMKRKELMLESPVYAQIIEEGRAQGHKQGHEQGHEQGHREGHREGHKQGHEEGHEEGRELTLRANVLTALSVRFGAVPDELAAQIHQMKGAERLEALFRQALVVDNLAALAREVAGST